MASKSTSRRAAPARTEAQSQRQPDPAPAGTDVANDAVARLACSQFECGLHMLDAMFRAAETIRSIQLGAARSARRSHEQALERLSGTGRQADLLGVATELLRFDADGSVHYWQAIGETMARLNADLLEASTRDFAALSQQAMQALNAAAASADPGTAPLGGGGRSRQRSEPDAANLVASPERIARQAADVANETWQRWIKMSEDFTRMALQPAGDTQRETAH